MFEVLSGFLIFTLGFSLGVWERKVEGRKINRTKVSGFFQSPGGEVLQTPSQEEIEKEEDKEFYDKMV